MGQQPNLCEGVIEQESLDEFQECLGLIQGRFQLICGEYRKQAVGAQGGTADGLAHILKVGKH
jgi:hypothetical protein